MEEKEECVFRIRRNDSWNKGAEAMAGNKEEEW